MKIVQSSFIQRFVHFTHKYHALKTCLTSKIKLHIYMMHFNKSMMKSYMTRNYHIWFKGRKNQLSTLTFDYSMVLSNLNVNEFYLFVIFSLGVYGIT
jgi:hypothetical protein